MMPQHIFCFAEIQLVSAISTDCPNGFAPFDVEQEHNSETKQQELISLGPGL
jgi:hypothetical protein